MKFYHREFRLLAVLLPLFVGVCYAVVPRPVYGVADVLALFDEPLRYPQTWPNTQVQMQQREWCEAVMQNYRATSGPGGKWYRAKLYGIITEASRKYEVAPRLIVSVMAVESAFRKGAVSCVGARGLMQVMPATGQYIHRAYGIPYNSKWQLHDERTSIMMGACYLRELITKYRNVQKALVAYNHGPGATDRMAVLPTRYTGMVKRVRLSVI